MSPSPSRAAQMWTANHSGTTIQKSRCRKASASLSTSRVSTGKRLIAASKNAIWPGMLRLRRNIRGPQYESSVRGCGP